MAFIAWCLSFVVLVAGEDGQCQPLMRLSHLPDSDMECQAIKTQHVQDATRLGCGVECQYMTSCPDHCIGFTIDATSSVCYMCLICPSSPLPEALSGNIWADEDFLLTTGIFITHSLLRLSSFILRLSTYRDLA